jgi:hypothetical protein
MNKVICYHCDKAEGCMTFRNLYSMSNNFCINECENYKGASEKYKKIAENDQLMHLIYDYFTGKLVDVSESKAKEVITSAMWSL